MFISFFEDLPTLLQDLVPRSFIVGRISTFPQFIEFFQYGQLALDFISVVLALGL